MDELELYNILGEINKYYIKTNSDQFEYKVISDLSSDSSVGTSTYFDLYKKTDKSKDLEGMYIMIKKT